MKEGILKENEQSRFELWKDGKYITYFTSGEPIECYIDGAWVKGRVEHREGGYYFYGGTKPFLYNGMKVRG